MLDRVPYEIFSEIIKLSYKHSSFCVFDADETSLPPIKATHVCRSWRAALLSDPTMWTCIRLDFAGRKSGEVEEMLSRSGSAPLDVLQISYSSSDPSQFVNLINILPHVHRFRNLQMFIPAKHANMVSRLLRQPAPMLRNLHLEMRESNEQEWDTLGEAYQNLFLGNAPNLRHVHLHIFAGLKELQSVSLFKNLSKLHLSFVSNMVIDGDILFGILHSSPCLRILNIILYSTIVCSVPSNHRTPLSCLQKLWLQGNCGVDNVDFVLGCLDFPVDKVHFDIACDDFYPKISHSRLLFHFLAQRPLSLLSISSNIWSEMAIEFFEKVDFSPPVCCPPSKKSSVFRLLYNHYAPLDTLSSLLRKFKMSDITHMYLEIIAFQSAVFRSIFPLLDNLQHLRVNHACWNEYFLGPFPRSYLKVLMSRAVQHSNPRTETPSESGTDDGTDSEPDDEASQAHLFPCPSLHILELAFAGTFEESYIQELVQCSKIREQAGHPFKSITICFRCSALVESARAWLQTHDLGRLHVEVTLWSMGQPGNGYA